MPELPEVEVTRLGISPYLKQKRVTQLIIRNRKLRWPINDDLLRIEQQVIEQIKRRAKYLILETAIGSAVIHLGMSGSLRIIDPNQADLENRIQKNNGIQENSSSDNNGLKPKLGKHDHIDLILENGVILRYNDPRRFGTWFWQDKDVVDSRLAKLGPEPLTDDFNAEQLFNQLQIRKKNIKSAIMDNEIVVGVGNIYATESLFLSGILPKRPSNQLTFLETNNLVIHIKQVLEQAIAQGGTTLKDFSNADGQPGYFAQSLLVYGKIGQPCPICGKMLQGIKLQQRQSVYCLHCQH